MVRDANEPGLAIGQLPVRRAGYGGRDGELRCANCGLTITWPPTLVDGVEYCCGGCALGGPCYCSYDDAGPVEQGLPRKGATSDATGGEDPAVHARR